MKQAILYKMRLLPVLLLLFVCQISPAADYFNVVVSIKPVHSIVAGLMKDIGKPQLLIDGEQTPYNFALDKTHHEKLQQANLLIWVGPELETSLVSVVSSLHPDARVIELLSNDNMKILSSRHNPNVRDPFFWLDYRNILILVDELTRLFIEIDPQRSHVYSRNRLEMLKPLLKIDKEYEYSYRGMTVGTVIQYFDMLQYFEQAYALNSLGYVRTSLSEPITGKTLLTLHGKIRNHRVNCLLTDKSLPAEYAGMLYEAGNINTAELDVFGTHFEPGEDLYLKLMEFNTGAIRDCLGADKVQSVENSDALTAHIGGNFILTDHQGQAFTERDMLGSYALIFFGYTSCPDICPTSLMILSQTFKDIDPTVKKQLVPYFISVDPERDTPDKLKSYVSFFTPELVGLTGTKDMIRRVADQFRAKYEKVDDQPPRAGSYTIDHTASLFLMGPDGRYITKFANGIAPDELKRQLQTIIH